MDAGDVEAQALGGFQIAAFEAGEEKAFGGAVLGRAPPTTTPESHISREGMKPFTKPPKMTTSKVRPKRSSGAAMATAGAGDFGVAASSFSHASLGLAGERAGPALDVEELSSARSAAVAAEVLIGGWPFSMCSASNPCASR